ncbi:MAG: type III secretion system cytoplasmic ring protein SctQ [Deltaproteobacteria bacterium]|jgi:type III secretion system YscQ/HrcQ family protein|nr:type III secretion system cytoplasmic ring protein SctQ [Deltaproteobacteria bacterium]
MTKEPQKNPPASPLKWSGKPWSQLDIDLFSTLSSLATHRTFNGQLGQITLNFLPFDSEPITSIAPLASLAFGNKSAALGLPDWSLIALHPAATGLDPERLPMELRLALLDSMLRPILDSLKGVLGSEVHIKEALTANWPSSGRLMRFELDFNGDQLKTSVTITLALSSLADLRWLMVRLSEIQRPKTVNFGSLPIPVRIVVGGVRLAFREIANLDIGDLIIPDNPTAQTSKAFLEYPGFPSATLDLSPGMAVATSALNIKETPVDDRSPNAPNKKSTPPNQAGARLTEDLELPLRFEIGRKMMTLRDLESLVPGTVLDTQNNPVDSVTVTCHGSELARGALVDLGDGRLGVQLTEVGLSLPIPQDDDYKEASQDASKGATSSAGDKPKAINRAPNFA